MMSEPYDKGALPAFVRRFLEDTPPPEEWADNVPEGTMCWVWQKSVNNSGYGQVKRNSTVWNVHRFTYDKLVERLPRPGKARRDEGNVILDHLCHNRRCANPAHLEKITQSENIKRGERWQS